MNTSSIDMINDNETDYVYELVEDSSNTNLKLDDSDDDEWYLYTLDSASYVNTLMHSAIKGYEYLDAVYRPVSIEVPRNPMIVPKVLFDTGALHTNYISKHYALDNIDMLRPYVKERHSKTTLADQKTTVVLEQVMILPVSVTDNSGQVHSATLPFWVFDMTGNDMIIGLPAILRHFSTLMVDMLLDAANNLKLPDKLSAISTSADLLNPWTSTLEIAPEEAQDEEPSSFPTFIAYVNTTLSDAVKDFHDKLLGQITPEFINGTKRPVVNLLRTKGEKVFVQDLEHWAGIQGIPPLKLELTENCPPIIKPKPRHINKRLFDAAQNEIERLQQYMYEPSISPWASCIVVAGKATHPFIRICGDYTQLNPYIKTIHHPIKHVKHEIDNIQKFRYFVNADLTNSFHQIPLHPDSREILSIVTPFGQLQPRFLPEGVSPASNVLQMYMDKIFADYSEWLLVIFDNLLVMAHSYDDLYDKLELFLDRCIQYNLRLKLSKTFFGQDKVDFFGYICGYQKYGLSPSRKEAIAKIPFPSNLQQMRSFLGSANFFNSFMPNYSQLTASLTDMTKKDFNWTDPTTWAHDYERDFNAFKLALSQAVEIFYPDYDLEWILRTDASQIGVGAVLFMVYKTADATEEFRPIGFVSHKFSAVAQKWSTIEQECFGCYFAIKSFSYLLRCKSFILETDHRNLLWMEKSEVAKIIRWRIYMQGFSFLIRHIPGKLNSLPDYMSRCLAHIPLVESHSVLSTLYFLCLLSPDPNEGDRRSILDTVTSVLSTVASDQLDIVLREVHNARTGHWGIHKTMSRLDELYPGHQIPYKVVADYINRCSICQKDRLGMVNSLKPIVRHLKPPHQRSTIGIDDLTITPADEYGNCHLIVIVVHFTKLAWGYPCKQITAENVASAMLIFFSIYGAFEVVMSDPGTAIVAEAVKKLNEYLGYKEHRVSLVDRHTSNGVEGTNAQILRHIRALVMEERVRSKWSAPTVLPLIFFIINSSLNSETNMVPYHAHFGTAEATYFQMPETLTPEEQTHEFVKRLDDNLKILNEASLTYQQQLVAERTKDTPENLQNKYQPGDYVLWLANDGKKPRENKLEPKFKGPYEVIKHHKNDVTCRHVNLGFIVDLDSMRLKRFLGTKEEAEKIAMIDQNQFLLDKILGYRGDINRRRTIEFLVRFADGTKVWKTLNKDITDTIVFEDYCRLNTELTQLLYTKQNSRAYVQSLRKTNITLVSPGDVVYVNLRSWGNSWYDQLRLPDLHEKRYVVLGKYGNYSGNKMQHISITFPVMKETYEVDNIFVYTWGHTKQLQEDDVVITTDLVGQYHLNK